jgi:hypothetical protein
MDILDSGGEVFMEIEMKPSEEAKEAPVAVEISSVGHKKARWTQLEKDVRKLNETRLRTKEILNALKSQYPNLTWEMVRAICNKKSKRVKRRK